jgi:RNA polymerase sigma-70 factor (ECF subfamily)
MPDTEGPDDEELVRRIRKGDADAARTLFDRHSARLRARVRRRLPRAASGRVDESDVIQEAWLAAFLNLGDFEDKGEGSFARWVDGILEHKALDEVRRHVEAEKRDARRDQQIRTTASRAGLEARGRSPSAELMSAERREMLRAQIARLPGDHGTILRLVHDEGLTFVAAGERMGRSADAARKLYGRALDGLIDCLAGRRGPIE